MDEYESPASFNNVSSIPKIRVVVRKRPPNQKEIQQSDIDIIEAKKAQTIIVKELKNKVDLTKYIEEHHFTFDRAYDEQSTNEQIYTDMVRPMISSAFKQMKVTCFAYGQTGSGKTFTMIGNNSKEMTVPGLYLLSCYDVFSHLKKAEYADLQIWVSFYEIYCNKLFDLLNDKAVLQAREDGKGNICIVGLVEKEIMSLKEIMAIIDYGLRSRTTGITGANMDSSRSHALLQISIKKPNGSLFSKISFVDLAGSERAVDTIDTNKQTKIDGAEINKSLLALKECIRALDMEKRHTPFRGSKLTLVLRDSFIGNSLTLMIANISPCLSCSEHTLNTLRYADRVKELRKSKNERDTNNMKDKDPNDIIANLLLMPRKHNSAITYTVDIKKAQPQSNHLNHHLNGNDFKEDNGVLHINQLIKQTNSNQNRKGSAKEASKQTSNKQGNCRRNKSLTTDRSKDDSSFPKLNHIDNYSSKYKNISIKTDDDYEKLSNVHEKLINDILSEEDLFITLHKSHIDDMVESIKKEMAFIQEVDKPGSNIDQYTAGVDRLLVDQINNIQKIRERLSKFRIMLKDEEALSSKFGMDNLSESSEENKNSHP